MKEHGLVKSSAAVKILANGDVSGVITVHAHKFSKSAIEKIEKSGGKAVIV
jgi:large subunit ribosomal protein L15